jgi:hypothetical protein
VRRGVSTLLLAGAGLAVLASASIAAGPARTARTARPTRTAAAKTFTLVTSPKCDTDETLVGNACYHNVQGTHLTFTNGAPSGSADFATNPAEGGAQWKTHFTWKVPTTLVAGTKIAGGIQLSVTVSDVKPEQPLSQGIKGFAPEFAQQIIAQYPSPGTASQSFDYTLPAGQTTDFTMTIEFVSSTAVYHYTASSSAPTLESYRFAAAATHPARVPAPTGRKTNRGWRVDAANSVYMAQPSMAYHETESTSDPLHSRGTFVRVKVTGTPQLVSSGAAKVVKLNVTVTEVRATTSVDRIVRCAVGSRGSIVLIDDHRVLAGTGGRGTRDQVVVSLPPCSFFSHTYTNADSRTHDPYRGGQQAKVIITTS